MLALQLVLSGSPAAWWTLTVCPMELEGEIPIFLESAGAHAIGVGLGVGLVQAGPGHLLCDPGLVSEALCASDSSSGNWIVTSTYLTGS